MGDIKQFIRKRGGVKHSMTAFQTFLNRFDASSTLDDEDLINLKERTLKLEIILQEFRDIQSNIECMCDEEKLVDEYQERDNFENLYFSIIGRARVLIDKNESNYERDRIENNSDSNAEASPGGSVTGSGAHVNINYQNYNSHVKLPTIELPRFAGSYEDWIEFRDTFDSLIHINNSLSNIQKLHYLRSSLQGRAAQIIRALEVSDANYAVAWRLLKERYDNKRLLVTNHIKAFLELPMVKNETAAEMRRLLDDLNKHLLALEALNQPVKEWGNLLVHIILGKLDLQTKREWETNRLTEGDEFPCLDDLKGFLKGRCELLESLEFQNSKRTYQQPYRKFKSNETLVNVAISENNTNRWCTYCDSKNHSIYACKEFLECDARARTAKLKVKKVCLNCLRKNHFSTECNSGKCKRCGGAHHTLLHYDAVVSVKDKGISNEQTSGTSRENLSVVQSNCSSNQSNKRVLLSTALVRVKDHAGNYCYCRALLDSGSESSFISKEFCDVLGIEKSAIDLAVLGINQSLSKLRYRTNIELLSSTTDYKTNINCYVIDVIAKCQQVSTKNLAVLNIPKNIQLADDSTIYRGEQIDLLLGADVIWDLFCSETIKSDHHGILLQRTVLGWVVTGTVTDKIHTKKAVGCNFAILQDVQQQLSSFWELEEILEDRAWSEEEQYCEDNFKATTERDKDGKFIVTIPTKKDVGTLGDSHETAKRRFYSLERRFERNEDLKQQYTAFLRQYEELGHMSRVTTPTGEMNYYMPHHGVMKEGSSTTRLRVVYDASCKTTTNISFNDIQCKGPVIQDELFDILIRFRRHPYVLSADVEKMYRQVWIHPDQRNLQRIVWREGHNEELRHYCLNTVTYGTTSAPYLAIRCLQETAYQHSEQHPKAAETIIRDFYVDDLLTGGSTVNEVIELQKEITKILRSGGFNLRKWMSNSEEVFSHINSYDTSKEVFEIGDTPMRKILGITWDPTRDCLVYSINDVVGNGAKTKREILSAISRLFDPLGLLGPCIVLSKLLLQEIWKGNFGWDDQVPENIQIQWECLKNELKGLAEIQIPRYICGTQTYWLELHSFSDASERSYGACLYIRAISTDKRVSVQLLCAKSKVAPIKSLTIPKLELCGAVIAAKLTNRVKKSMGINFHKIHHWCDSTIVLSWLRLQPNSLKVFVSNRVSKIQTLTNPDDWRHVSGKDNPADFISRGVKPSKLSETCWFTGPDWLQILDENMWPKATSQVIGSLPEVKNSIKTHVVSEEDSFPFHYTNSLKHLQKIVAWCLRIKHKCNNEGDLNHLTTAELEGALLCLVKLAQQQSMTEIIMKLKGGTSKLPSGILSLSPFIDNEGLVRVGGRLKNSDFDFQKKHPLLISGKHRLASIILYSEHLRLYHAGPQLMLTSVREKYWITGGRSLARSIAHKCVICLRSRPKCETQIMGNLPKERLTAKYPFFATGIDFGGPISVKERLGRGTRSFKCYICLFICMATRAIHLEPVTDLSRDAFVATLRRFVARRGRPTHIYSDNGTNFVSGNSYLKELGQFLINNNQQLSDSASIEGIEWHFIPARSPHFGGLWEAGIKGAKTHLRKILQNALVTLEDLLTVLAQIESILNSRPLHPLSPSPNDLQVLTPSHFLIGRNATALPDPLLVDVPTNRLKRFQQLQQLQQRFWKTWSRCYIQELQQKQKWYKQHPNIKEGDLVLIQDDNLPSLSWKLGRVIQLHPDGDGIVRVVSLKTATSVVKRSVAKLCVLPTN